MTLFRAVETVAVLVVTAVGMSSHTETRALGRMLTLVLSHSSVQVQVGADLVYI